MLDTHTHTGLAPKNQISCYKPPKSFPLSAIAGLEEIRQGWKTQHTLCHGDALEIPINVNGKEK